MLTFGKRNLKILLGAATTSTAGYGYATFIEYKEENAMKSCFLTGSCPLLPPGKTLISRSALEKELNSIIAPSIFPSRYVIISGEHGTGKTIAVMKTCHAIGRGVIYINAPEDPEFFSLALKTATKYSDTNIGFIRLLQQQLFGNLIDKREYTQKAGTKLFKLTLILKQIQMIGILLWRNSKKMRYGLNRSMDWRLLLLSIMSITSERVIATCF